MSKPFRIAKLALINREIDIVDELVTEARLKGYYTDSKLEKILVKLRKAVKNG